MRLSVNAPVAPGGDRLLEDWNGNAHTTITTSSRLRPNCVGSPLSRPGCGTALQSEDGYTLP